VNQNYVNFFLIFTVNQHFLVHENLNKNFKLSLKNGREPELCEPFFWNYVNHGSHNGQAPKTILKRSLQLSLKFALIIT
jgi:hypothetical protein